MPLKRYLHEVDASCPETAEAFEDMVLHKYRNPRRSIDLTLEQKSILETLMGNQDGKAAARCRASLKRGSSRLALPAWLGRGCPRHDGSLGARRRGATSRSGRLLCGRTIDEMFEELQAVPAAFLGVELNADHILMLNGSRDPCVTIGVACDQVLRPLRLEHV